MRIQFSHPDIEKFIISLDKPTIAKVLRTIDLLEKFGPKLGPPHSKKIRDGLFELRIRSLVEVRLLYTITRFVIIVLHGFIKKSQKIPDKEIALAQSRLRKLTTV